MQNPDHPPFYTVAIYLTDRAYGGPEEGGWWYNCGEREDGHISDEHAIFLPKMFPGTSLGECAAIEWCNIVQDELDRHRNKGRYPIGSVLSTGVYEARVTEGWPPERFPEETPHYE